MIPVYICEDSEATRIYLTKQIKKFIMIENFDMEVVCTTENPEILLDEVYKHRDRGIYFLDIDLSHKLNGFEVAKLVRQKDPRGFVVFVTTHGELAFETFRYQIEAMDYILKDEPDEIVERIHMSLRGVHQRMAAEDQGDTNYFIIRQMDEVRYINYQEIIYFETSPEKHKVVLVTGTEYIEFFDNLKAIEEKTGEQFIRCHRSYLVNKNYIEKVNAKENVVIMKDGKRCDLSRSGKKRMEEQLNRT